MNILGKDWCKELTHLKRPWCWERLKAGWEGDDREWDGWMASLTQGTWVWVNSRRWWWTGRLGVLQSMGVTKSQAYWMTELKDEYNIWDVLQKKKKPKITKRLSSKALIAVTSSLKIHYLKDCILVCLLIYVKIFIYLAALHLSCSMQGL